MDETLDRLIQRDHRADEDREHNRESGEAFAAQAPEEERETKRDRGQRIAEVVDQVGQQCHAESA